jgi:hypothetical protein
MGSVRRHAPEEPEESEPLRPASHSRELLPPLSVPTLATTAEGLHDLPLDARAAYLLSLVDGRSTLETLLDVCEMDREDTLGVLRHLLALGAIRLHDR